MDQILILHLPGSEVKGLLSCPPHQHLQSCLPQGSLLFFKCPGSFMMIPPFIMNSCCFGPKLSLSPPPPIFFSLPFKFGFKSAHMHTHDSPTLPRSAGGWEAAKEKEKGKVAGWVLCELLSTCSLLKGFRSLFPPSKHQGIEGCFEMWQALSACVRACAMKHKNLLPYRSD